MKSVFFSFILILFSAYTINCDTIVWNVQSDSDFSFSEILSGSNQQPVLIFIHPNFELSQFSRQVNAYGSKNDGGRLKNLKKWIDRTEGYTVSSTSLSNSLLRYFDTTDYDSNNPPSVADVAVLLINVQDWDDLDIKADEVRRLFKGKKYVAMLTSTREYRLKRQAELSTVSYSTELPTTYVNYTLLQVDQCKLYAKNIQFVTKVTNYTTGNQKSTGLCKITLDQNPTQYDTQCSNYSGILMFSYSNPGIYDDCNGGLGTLDSLTITMSFFQNNFTDAWSVERIDMSAKGTVIQNPENSLDVTIYDRLNRTWDFNYIQGAQSFAYACSSPQIAFAPPIDRMGKDKLESQFAYGLAFKDLIVQPFHPNHNVTDSLFTDNIDDCVPFFNIYIWMLIVSGLLLVGIILCGMGMMSSLKTMDRFDDMRAKTITVNVVN